MTLQRCLNCGHTGDLSKLVCPSCGVELELLPGEMSMTTIALCSLKGGTYNHVWRFVTARLSDVQPTVRTRQGRALWQCDDCHRIVEGRAPNIQEAQQIDRNEDVIVQSVEVP